MAHETVEGIGESLFAMDDVTYSEGLAKSLLPENHKFKFKKMEVVRDMDEFGEIQMMVIGRTLWKLCGNI
jgi:hypothetical protein